MRVQQQLCIVLVWLHTALRGAIVGCAVSGCTCVDTAAGASVAQAVIVS